jgi:hypothetical protein
MAGKIKLQMDAFISEVSKNNPVLVSTTRTKLILKGIDPNKYTRESPDDPVVLEKLRNIAEAFGVKLGN